MLTATTLITGAFPGIYCGALPEMCWAADSRRILLDTAQRSQQVRGWQGTQGRPGWVRPPLDSALMPLGCVRGGHGDRHHNFADSW